MSVIRFDVKSLETALGKAGVVMVDFWAEWCGPCRMLGPVVEELAQLYQGRATVGKVNVDEQKELAAHYGVMSIPTVIFFKNGVEVERLVGVMPQGEYTRLLDANL